MDVLEKKIENQVQFWSLLGPFLILLSVTVLLFKVSSHWYFPVAALIGLPLCVKWKMKGMAAALSCLLFFSVLAYQNLELDERYWHVGMVLAMAFSFIVLTLSLEEVQNLVDKLQIESQSRLDNFLRLDEKWKSAEQEWGNERTDFKTEIQSLTQEASRIQEDKQTFYKLAQLAKDELMQVRSHHDLLLKELFYKKQQIAQLNERLEETEITIQGFVNSDAEKQLQQVTDQLAYLEREKERLDADLTRIQKDYQVCQQAKDQACEELQKQQEQEKQRVIAQQNDQQEQQAQQTALQAIQEQQTVLEQEKQVLLEAQTKWQQQREQMQALEMQHRQAVQHYQQQLQELASKLSVEEQRRETLQQRKKELEDLLTQREKQFKDQENHLQAILKSEVEKIKTQEQQTQQQLLQAQQALQTGEEQGLHMQQQVKELQQLLKLQQDMRQKAEEEIQLQVNDKRKLEQMLQKAQEELVCAKKQSIEVEIEDKRELLPYAEGNTRRIESMYIQLKEQFQEKSAVLDTTRRELFHAHEELLKYQKELEEEKVFGQTDLEQYLQSDLLELEQQYEQMQRQYQQEVEELNRLVEHLLQQLVEKRFN